MTYHELFSEVVEQINDRYLDNDVENIISDDDLRGLELRTDCVSSAIYYRDILVMGEEDFNWCGEEEGDPRYGKSECDCLVEDVIAELEKISRALISIITIAKGKEHDDNDNT